MLREAVASVLAQTYRPIEIVIVDDGSTDNDTPGGHRRLARAIQKVRGIRRPNGGPGLAREAGRAEARGEFIQYLDSDDLLMPRKFELQVAALEAHPECGVAYGIALSRCRGKRDRVHVETGQSDPEDDLPPFLVARWWDTPTPLYRRSVCDAAGP